ncbi:MAG: insulinase family protein [Bacteroidota bacterium]
MNTIKSYLSFLLGMLLLLSTPLSAQVTDILQVESYKLDNGFTVFLNQDPSASKVFGAVMVNAGAVNEDPNATGMAHYLEHLLFKGTDEMGTSDFSKEKPHLDSINVLYDQLAATEVDAEKLTYQKLINEQAVAASKFGLPNDFDKLLRSIGGESINAFTSYEMTFYHNSFPAHEIEKWLDLYSIRFNKAVFRSFQSELEVVYEEKNRAMDNMQRKVFENISTVLFPNMPYGQWSVLGKTEHLKKPSINTMYDFFRKQYVAENMALILTGNFDKEKVKPIIAEKFKRLRTGKAPKLELEPLQPLEGVARKTIRITPVKAGFVGWQTVGYNHPDRLALDIAEFLLFNESETGFINEIQLNNEMIYSGAIPITHNHAGAFVLFFVPRPVIQSLSNAQNKCLAPIEKLKKGEFTPASVDAAKNTLANYFEESLEDIVDRGIFIGEAFNRGLTWEEYLAYPQNIRGITKDDVMRVANKYFGEDRMEMVSKTGFGKPQKLEKPPYKPVVTEQKGRSPYEDQFEAIPSLPFQPKFLDFDKDVERFQLNNTAHEVVRIENPVNDQFDLRIRFHIGTNKIPELAQAADLLDDTGAGTMNQKETKNAFAALGCSYYINASTNYFTIYLDGNEKNVKPAVELLGKLLYEPSANQDNMKVLYNGESANRKLEKKNPSAMGSALFYYAAYGQESQYLNRASLKEIKGMKADDLLNHIEEVVSKYKASIEFIGDTPSEELERMFQNSFKLSELSKSEPIYSRQGQEVQEIEILIINDKKAIQSQIYYYIPGETFSQKDYPYMRAFNEYFGGGFSGLVLQEIREYRSLAYSTGARYNQPLLEGTKGWMYTFIGCQGDKTTEAIEVMNDLVSNMPLKPERMENLQKSLKMKVVTNFPSFKNIPDEIETLQRRGWKQDPNIEAYKAYQNLQMEDIEGFYKEYVKGKPYIITIYGDMKRFDMEKIRQMGKVTILDSKDIATF